MRRLTIALLLLAAPVVSAAPVPVTLTRGDWTATLSSNGLALTHRGTVISTGSYLTIFKPEYQGAVMSSGEAWQAGKASATADGSAVTLTADLPGGRYEYTAALEPQGVRITLQVDVAPGQEVGPVEYPVAHFPLALLSGATVETSNVAGMVIASQPVPDQPGSGAIAPSGATMILRTPERTIVVEAVDATTVYPFDGRAERYGAKRGIWPFASPGFTPGFRTTCTYLLRIEPPAPPRQPGAIRVGPSTPAVSVMVRRDPGKRETLAADELTGYLEKMTGQRLPRRETLGTRAPAGAIVLGQAAVTMGLISQAELDAVAPDGYVVRVRDGRAAVCGWRDVGTVYGAYALLRRLGCRFYAPSCEVVPQSMLLVLPDCTLSDKPRYEFRNVNGNMKLGHTPGSDLMNPAELGEPGNIVHSSDYLLPFDKYHETHPEYFALQKNGKRLSREGEGDGFNVHLCLSNPDVRRISAERMVALIDRQPDRKFFGVSQGDGFAWCQCDNCKALDAIPGVAMTDRLLDYVNYIAREVAKKYPDKRILTLAYTDATSPPPTRVMPESNVMVQYCPYPHRTDCQSHDFTCEKNVQGYKDVMGWFAKCPDNMYIFDYPMGYQNWYEPFGSFWAMKSKLDLYAANGVKGLFYCGTPLNFRDLFIYVQSELLWHPQTPVEPLIREFMDAYYGPAAPAVRRYFDFLSREMKERPIHQMCEGASPHTVTPAYADTALAMLAEAEQAAAGDRARLYRVRAEKICVLFGDLNARNPANGKLAISEDLFAARLAEFCGLARTMRLSDMVRRVPMDEWLYRTARIRPARKPWYADPVVDRLLARPLETLQAERQLYTQTAVPGGLRLELDGFRGARGPEQYAHECPARRAIWIYGTNTDNSVMSARFSLPSAPAVAARLVLTGQDDDKPGAVPIRVELNGREVFSGPNKCAERNWSAQEFVLPAGVLKVGENELQIGTTAASRAADQGWFMLAECLVLTP